ncbi:hypothetical protein ACVGVM_15610 [Pseudonocardia bannensis]|uniref:Secreted protein n=1 Tax=Pseudonocardia bannensis TaxID=630973 RepID=A0A848DP12_9PSEU|nr:hypothetical protein [Pseudonocardia bannensis]NMH94084.1 hypothetical protein [Pseudonocardia bannensis]
MRKLHRAIVGSVIAVPIAFTASGIAQAGEEGTQECQSYSYEDGGNSTQRQSNSTDQSNSNGPVTQVNPVVNAEDVLGVGALLGEESAGEPPVIQDNSVSNDQSNDNSTAQDQG